MKLIDLEPRWMVAGEYEEPDGTIVNIANNLEHGRHGMGMTFLCPLHSDHRAGIFFDNPVDGKPPARGVPLWHREGETFELMSLAPSIVIRCTGSWHGHLRNGSLEPV